MFFSITHVEASSDYFEELCDLTSCFNSSLKVDFGKQYSTLLEGLYEFYMAFLKLDILTLCCKVNGNLQTSEEWHLYHLKQFHLLPLDVHGCDRML